MLAAFCDKSIVDRPELFEELGFSADEGLSLASPCLTYNFAVDYTAEIMGTQVSPSFNWMQNATAARNSGGQNLRLVYMSHDFQLRLRSLASSTLKSTSSCPLQQP